MREHGPIVHLAENLWWVSGSLPNMTLRRTMTVVRLGGGELLLYSPIAMRDEAMRELETLGAPTWWYRTPPTGWMRRATSGGTPRSP